jgi:dihydrofolate reductase
MTGKTAAGGPERELILKMSISVDGFVGGPDGELAWLFPTMDDEAIAWQVETLSQAGVHIMGSRTFRDMAAYYPTSTMPYASPMNEIPKVFFSRTGAAGSATRGLTDANAQPRAPLPSAEAKQESWDNARVAAGELAGEITRLKQEPGNYILAHGGASFAGSLVKLGLIDEFRLLVHPVALGRGLPLFNDLSSPLNLSLVDAKAFGSGTVAHVYRNKQT